MSEIVLIIPPFSYGSLKRTGNKTPALGIASIASVLEKNGYSVKILDAFALEMEKEEILKSVLREDPKIVGITSVTLNSNIAMEILKSIKKRNKEIITVYGGPHATFMYEEILKKSFIDFVVVGEGEYTMLELCNFLLKGKGKLQRIKGICFKHNKKIVKTKARPLIKDLDELPFPAYHLLPLDHYQPNAYLDTRRKFCSIMTSRGCPYNCLFCTTPKLWGNWRCRSVPKVCEELLLLYEKYKVSQLFIKDDEFTVNRKRVEKICDFIIKNKLDIVWECLGRVNDVNDKILKKMYKAGCRSISYGVESGYEDGLRKLRKGITLNQVRKAVKLTQKNGIIVNTSFLLGLPWESSTEIRKTINFAKSLGSDIIYFNLLVPYPGSDIRKIIEEKKLFSEYSSDLSNYTMHGKKPVIRTEYLSADELQRWRGRAYLELFFTPSLLFRNLKSYGSLKRKLTGGLELFLTSIQDILQ